MGILLTDEETAQVIFQCKGTVKDARREVNKAQLKKVVEELRANGWVLARKKDVSGAWILDLVGWETLDWQALLKEVESNAN